MKNILLTIVATLLCGQIMAERVIENPHYEARTSSIPEITKIEISDSETRLYLRCTHTPNWWFTIDKDTFIQDADGDEKHLLKALEGGEVDTKIVSPKEGYTDLVLIFDPLSEGITKIDFFEEDGWKIVDIDLKESIWSSKLPKELKGNYFDSEGVDGWCYGLYEQMAIINNKAYQYNKVKRSRGGWAIELTGDDESRTLYITPSGDQFAIGEAPRPTKLYSTTKPPYSGEGFTTRDLDLMKEGTFVLNGYIEGYSPKLGYSTGIINIGNDFLNQNEQALITIDESGYFSATAEVPHGQTSFMRLGKVMSMSMMIIPGDSVTLYLNNEDIIRNRDKEVIFMGKNSRLMNEFRPTGLGSIYNGGEFSKIKTTEIDIELYQDSLSNKYARGVARMEQIIEECGVMPATETIARASLLSNFYSQSITYFWYNRDFITNEKEEASGVIVLRPNMESVPSDYFERLRSVDVTDITSLLICNFDAFINRYEFAPFQAWFSPKFNTSKATERLITAGVVKPNEAYIKSRDKEAKLDSMELVSIRDLFRDNLKLVEELFVASVVYMPAEARMQDQIAKSREFWSEEGNIIPQAAITRRYIGETKDLNEELSKRYIDLMFKYVSHPFIRSTVMKHHNERFGAKESLSGYKPIPEGAGKAVCERLLTPHRGKYVIMDFWTTSCGPCIYAIQNSHDLRERLEGKPIVSLFVTDDRSSLESYNKYMETTKGDKQRLMSDEWDKLTALFGVNSYPRYILFSPDGQVVDDKFGGWSVLEDKLRELGAL